MSPVGGLIGQWAGGGGVSYFADTITNAAGNPGGHYGGGGAGGTDDTATRAGGDGGPGVVVVIEEYSGSSGAGGVSAHALLDGGAAHSDSVIQAVSRGSLVYGNSTPKWDELVLGAASRLLRSDGTDPSWAQVALATDVSGTLPVANGGTLLTSLPGGGLVGGRLTLTSGAPVTTSDVLAATTLYYTPYRGGVLPLYDGARFSLYSFSEISVAVPATLFRVFDIFAYLSGGAAALETNNWNQTTVTATAATAATPCVVTSAGHGLSNGTLVGTAGFNNSTGSDATNGINGRTWRVANVAANTFELEGSKTAGLAASTTGTVYVIPNTRATALAYQEGLLTKFGDATRLYLGIGMTTGVSGQTEDSEQYRLLVNYYNRIQRRVMKLVLGSSHTYNVEDFRLWNLNYLLKRHFLSLGEDAIFIENLGGIQAGTAGDIGYVGIGLNASTGNGIVLGANMSQGNTQQVRAALLVNTVPSEGYNFASMMEFGDASSAPTFATAGIFFNVPG